LTLRRGNIIEYKEIGAQCTAVRQLQLPRTSHVKRQKEVQQSLWEKLKNSVCCTV